VDAASSCEQTAPEDASLPAEQLLAIIQTQNEIVASSLELESVLDLVVRRARELVSAAAAVVELVEDEGSMIYRAASGTAAEYVGLRLGMDSSLSGACVSEGRVLQCEDARTDRRVDRVACDLVGARSIICAPLAYGADVVGVLKVYDPAPRAFAGADVATIELLSGVVAAHLVHASDYQEQAYANLHDALTGLPNGYEFDARLAAEAARVRRYGDSLAVCLLDIDRFHRINDTLGQAAGDAVLRRIALHLDELRGEDAAYRIGDDEFAMVLVGADQDGAEHVAERLVETIAQDRACHGVTVSWGVSTLDDGDPDAAVARADAALYVAKHERSG
jgi:diguanylate cyclase (GGDEF)-like protein